MQILLITHLLKMEALFVIDYPGEFVFFLGDRISEVCILLYLVESWKMVMRHEAHFNAENVAIAAWSKCTHFHFRWRVVGSQVDGGKTSGSFC